MIIIETESAFRDVAGILDYLLKKSPKGAANVALAYREAKERLTSLPYASLELDEQKIRRIPLAKYPYTIFLIVDADLEEVQILRVVHSARVKDLGSLPDLD